MFPLGLSVVTRKVCSAMKNEVLVRTVVMTMGAALCAWNAALAEDWPGVGKYVATDASSFVNPDDPATPFVLGEGMLLYTGSSTLTDVMMTLNVASGNGANAINVQNADTTLTLAGKINHTRGCFVKTGPGTLALAYPGYQLLGPGPQDAGKLTRDVKWDETTGACTNGSFANFTLDQGSLVMGAPGQTNEIKGMVFVGNRTQSKVRLAVTNGVLKQSGNWLCVARGTGQTTNDAEAEFYVGKDARVDANQLNLGYANSVSSPWPRSRVIVDGGTMTVLSEIYSLENGNGKSEMTVKNGGSFANTGWNWLNAGWRIQNGDGGASSVSVESASTAKTRYLAMRKNSSLTVKDGSTFLFDRMAPTSEDVTSISNAFFNGSTLGSENVGQALWFSGMNAHHIYHPNRFFVGADGLTVSTPEKVNGALFPPVKTASGATAANVKITKTGAGSLALVLPYQNPIEVKAGDLRLRNRNPNTAEVPSQTPTLAAGSKLVAAGEEAFANITVPAGTPVVLRPQGLEMDMGFNWNCNGWAAQRPDGLLGLSDTRAVSWGSAFLRQRKFDVSKSFRVTFDVAMLVQNASSKAGGFSVCFNANGSSLLGGTSDTDLGYRYGSFTNAANKSVAMIADVNNLCFRFGQNGLFVGNTLGLGIATAQVGTTFDAPHNCTLDYDAAAGRLSLTIRFRTGIARTFTRDVNLADALGASSAYFGFTGSTHSSNPVDYYVSNVAFADADSPVAQRMGGNVTASAATPLVADVVAREGDPALVMKKLTYSDGAVLDIDSAAVGGKGEIGEMLSLANHDEWKLYSAAHWLADGSLGLSYTNYNAAGEVQRVCGVAAGKRPLPVDGDWTLDFDFDFGRFGGGVKADCFHLGFSTRNDESSQVASTGFDVECRYYTYIPSGTPDPGPWDGTRLHFRANNAAYRSSDWVENCSPVCLYYTMSGHFTFVHSAAEKKLTIKITDDRGSFTKTLTDFDLRDVLGGSDTAYVRFQGQVGGSWTENVISNLRLSRASRRADAVAALGFDTWSGSGTVVKRGSGALASVSNNTQNVSVKVEEGGLYLAKEQVNDVFDNDRGGWLRSDAVISDAEGGGVCVGYHATNDKSDAHYRRRLPMGRSWRLTADLYIVGYQDWGNGGEQEGPGNAITIFCHNDSKGLAYRGASSNSGGFGNSVQNGWALNFFVYTDAGKKQRFCWTTGGEDYSRTGRSDTFAPIIINNRKLTHFDITHDASAKTVKVELSQGANTHTTTFSDVNLKSMLGNNDFAWFGFGTGGGGAHGVCSWHNVRLSFPDGADADQTANFFKNVEITAPVSSVQVDSRRANGVFRLAPTVSVAAGSAMVARSVGLPSTLTMGTLTLGEGATVGGDANTVVKPDALVTTGDLHVEGTTLALNSTDAVGDDADVYLTSGAKLRLDFNGTLFVRRVYVDGVRQPRNVFGPGTDWIDPASTGSLANGSGLMLLLR